MVPFSEGVILGLTLSILAGPAFVTIVQTSIQKGFAAGAILVFGIFMSDLTILTLSYLGATQILSKESNHFFFGIIGGLVLIGFGIYTFTRKVLEEDRNNSVVLRATSVLTYIFKGYFLNVANPFLWIFWMGVTVGVTSGYKIDSRETFLFFGGLMATILTTDLLKCFVANKIKAFLRPVLLTWINRIVGISLVVFGVVLVLRVVLAYMPGN
jgi:threonine/homoserine/homoserine lactone efflux protein